jgi:Holliday junction resolvase RusA-like endonuclease
MEVFIMMNKNWEIVNVHGFSVNKMYKNNSRTHTYNKWCDNTLKQMESLPTLDTLGVDPTKPMKIDIIFYTVRGVDIDNLIKSFLDVLVKHYDMEDDNNFVDIHFRRGEKFVEQQSEGSILFNIENCDGLVMDIYDKLLLDIKYLL